MKLKAYAKINLSLRVFERLPDGYHAIESIMQSVSLCDYITVERISSGIEIICDNPHVPVGNENIAYKAAEKFLEYRKQAGGWKIQIEKRIPMAAGLAGGSADAAAVLFGMNQLSNIDSRLSNIELIALASQIGFDVPFCLIGGTCLVKGRGEIVEKLEPWPQSYFVLVNPDVAVSTKWAYAEFDRLHINLSEKIKNDLEPVVIEKYPIVADIKEELVQFGCREAQMSGSGPTVFGIISQRAEAERIYQQMQKKYEKTYLVETVDEGVRDKDRKNA